MKNTIIRKAATVSVILLFALNGFADDNKITKQPVLKNKTTNPNYDPNRGIMGKTKEEKIIKRTRNEPIIKNRKYEPIIKKNK